MNVRLLLIILCLAGVADAQVRIPGPGGVGAGGGGGGFACTDFSGCKLWLKADALVLSDTDPVSTWADSSGNGFDVTQGTSGFRPVYRTNILNSLPVVRFDGSDDFLSNATAVTTATSYSYCIVGKTTNNTIDNAFIYVGNGDGFGYLVNANRTLAHRGVANMADTDTAPQSTTNYEVICVTRTSTGPVSTLYLNGTSRALTTNNEGLNAPSGFTTIGQRDDGGRNLVGDIAEIMVWDNNIGSTNVATATTALCTKWGITCP